MRDKPSGTIRITAHDDALRSILWPALEMRLPDFTDIKVEIVIDYGPSAYNPANSGVDK